MAKKRALKATTVVQGPDGVPHTFGPDDKDIPDWATEQFGDHLYEEQAESGAPVPARNAAKAEWVTYADRQDDDDHESLTKEELVDRYGSK